MALNADIHFGPANGFGLTFFVGRPKFNLEAKASAFGCFFFHHTVSGDDFVSQSGGHIFANKACILEKIGTKLIDTHF